MVIRNSDGDAAANLLERRWFAAFKAASSARSECEALLESMSITQAAWNSARARLYELEAIRDALDGELEALDAREAARSVCDSEMMTAA
jgi:hypothetical protein